MPAIRPNAAPTPLPTRSAARPNAARTTPLPTRSPERAAPTHAVTEPHPGKLASAGAVGDNGLMGHGLKKDGTPKRPASKKLSIAEVDTLRRRIGAGELSIAEAARRLGRSETSVRRAIRGQEWHCRARSYKDANAPAVPARLGGGRPPSLSDDAIRAIRAAEGKNKEIAARFGVSATYVSKVRSGAVRSDVEGAPVEAVGSAP